MTIDVLRQVVATCPETHIFQHKRMVPEALLLSVCCGLISIDKETRLVRLMRESSRHSASIALLIPGCRLDYTARDAILPRILELFPVPHAILALVCINHLTTSGLQRYRQDARAGDDERRDFMARISNDPFLSYTHRSWVHHTRQCSDYIPVTSVASDLLLNSTQYSLADHSPVDFGGPLHVAAFYGLEDVIPFAAQRSTAIPKCADEHLRKVAVDAGSPARTSGLCQSPPLTAGHRRELNRPLRSERPHARRSSPSH
jgi:ankyrin repeat domain-containing protein 50